MILNEKLSLLIVVLAAAILPTVSRRMRLPGTVSEILFGIILGQSLLNLEFAGDWLPFLSELGFLLLMFQAGMEIDFAMLRQQSRGRLLFHIVVFVFTFGLSLTFSLMLGFGMFLSLVLSTTSLGLVLPTLRELGLSKDDLGQSILIAATLADFLTLLGITLFLLWHQYGLSWRFLAPVPLIVCFGLLLRLARLWAWWHPEKVERIIGLNDNQEIGVRLSLALLFIFVAISEVLHIEPVLGAFMGGCVLSFAFREKGMLESKISALGFGFLVPIFFIYVGHEFNLASVFGWEQIVLMFKLLGLAFLVKIIPALLFVFLGRSFMDSLRVGILLSTRLSLIVAAAAIGVQQGLIGADMKDSIVLLAVVSCLVGPTLFKATEKVRQSV